jgi:hypothetical protein
VCEQAALWHDDVVAPLRAVRRKLKGGSTLVERNTAELFRTRIKAVELEAERLQQEAMYQLADASPLGREVSSPEDAARSSVAAYAAIRGGAFPQSAIETLLAALTGLERKPEE